MPSTTKLGIAVFMLAPLFGAVGCAVIAANPDSQSEASTTALGTELHNFGTLASPGKCLDIQGAGTADGTPAQSWTCNGTGAQAFRVEDLGDGVSRLVNPSSGKCLDVAAGGTADGTNVQLWTCNGSPAQSFRLRDAGGGNVAFVNTNSGKCIDVAAQGQADGTKVQLWTCNGTVAQVWRPAAASTTPPPPPPPPPTSGLPAKVVAGYYPNWTPSPVRIRDVNANYNLIYLFAATPVGGAQGSGALTWSAPGDGRGAATNLKADIQYARTVQGRKILLSVGGAGAGIAFSSRAKSQTFVNSFVAIANQLGGVDGLDWNTFEADQAPNTGEMIWMSLELKRLYPGFIVTAPPAPWNSVDKTFCAAMVNAGALDYAAPQYYDGPNLATRAYITTSVDEWSKLLGESHVVVGFGIWNQPNYMAIDDAVSTWNQVEANHPSLRGAFDWTLQLDEGQGYPFASRIGPLVTQ